MMKITFHDWSDDPQSHAFTMRDTVSCKVTFHALKEADWVSLGVEEGFQLSGSLSPRKKVLHTHIFSGNTEMKAGEKRTFDFSTELYRVVSYRGKNGSAKPQFTGFARPPVKREGFWGSWSGRKGWAQTKTDLWINEAEGFKIGEQPVVMTVQRNNLYMTGLFLCCAALLALTLYLGWPSEPLIGLSVAYPAAVIYRTIVIRSIGDAVVHPQSLGVNNFLVRVSTTEGGTRFSSIEAWYEVVEQVVDDRGTSSSTYNHNLHTSPKDVREAAGNDYRFEHRFVDCPPSRNYGDLKVLWNYHLRIKARMGLEFEYIGPLYVERG